MNKIQLLDNNTINKIAAGEVVERPSSVVKELVENSIDADSSAITIEIKDGGVSLIRIADNGRGIPKEQVKTAFLRHATNKIQDIDDLESIFSLGFRGEALASIASVSQMEMTTKTIDAESGVHIEINGGEYIGEQDAGCSDGTTIVTRNLFYNVPARRKFLKKTSTESSYISDIVNKIALGHPEISFKYINNDTVILHTAGNNDLKTAVLNIYGKDAALKMLELNFSRNGYTLNGLIGRPELSRANRSYENLFINGRFVKSEVVSSAVEDAYKTRLLVGKFPFYVINFKILPSLVDVNVHPAKLEVKFHDDDEIYKFIYDAITDTFKDKQLIPQSNWESKNSPKVSEFLGDTSVKEEPVQSELFDIQPSCKSDYKYNNDSIMLTPSYKKNDLLNNNTKNKKLVINQASTPYIMDNVNTVKKNNDIPIEVISEENNYKISETKVEENTIIEEKKSEFNYTPFFNNYKIIGQAFSTYWIVEQSGSLFLIDQHAAHERVLFEELLNKLKNEQIISQRLLQPIVVNLTINEKQILKDNFELLTSFGFEIEEFGQLAYALRSVPFIFKEPTNVSFFTEIIDMLSNSEIKNIYDTKILAIATTACKAAVKANDRLSFQEARALIEQLLKLENPFTCPHGRPTIIEMTKYELEKKFKRIQ